MTAEIALLNKSAVALAADSAVTLTVRGSTKIYNSVDKLFHISNRQPVGAMLFGGTEYMEIPFEVSVKQFRLTDYAKPKATIREYADAFFSFLLNDMKVSSTLE